MYLGKLVSGVDCGGSMGWLGTAGGRSGAVELWFEAAVSGEDEVKVMELDETKNGRVHYWASRNN